MIYQSGAEDLDILSVSVEQKINTASTATVVLPPAHPFYNRFDMLRSIVEIELNGEVLLRGRPLKPAIDMYGRKTVTIEGELCFLCDSLVRPMTLTGTSDAIFATLITNHNLMMSDDPTGDKTFICGEVSATSTINYNIEVTEPTPTLDVLKSLLELRSGYILFSSDENGNRVIHYINDRAESYDTHLQAINFGDNLLDIDVEYNYSDIATAVMPYGAETDGVKLTLDPDVVSDNNAVESFGYIVKFVEFDTVTDVATLKDLAEKELARLTTPSVTVSLTALDLSYVESSVDMFHLGDHIKVTSYPHGVDGVFVLTSRKLDLFKPDSCKITLGNTVSTLSSRSAAAVASAVNKAAKALANVTSKLNSATNN